jgi:hypothetical protein
MNYLREYWARRGVPGDKKLGDLGSFWNDAQRLRSPSGLLISVSGGMPVPVMSRRAGFGGLLFETTQSQTCMIFCIARYRREQEEIARSFKKKLQFSAWPHLTNSTD